MWGKSSANPSYRRGRVLHISSNVSVHFSNPMKLKLIIILIISSPILLGQVKNFEPNTILNFPNLNPDSIALIQKRVKEFHELINKDFEYDELTSYQKKLFQDELLLSEGPFYTGPYGCSWYCAAWPENISSTTELDSNQVANYQAANLHDFDLQTAWVEGKQGYGIDEEIDFEFQFGNNSPLELTKLVIYNGYSKNLSTWNANSRVKSLQLKINDQIIGNLNLMDTHYGQVFEIGNFKGDENGKLLVNLKISKIYRGDKYSDTAISEINFDGIGDH